MQTAGDAGPGPEPGGTGTPPADLLPIHPEGQSVASLVAEGRSRLQALLPEYRDPRGPRLLRTWLTNLL